MNLDIPDLQECRGKDIVSRLNELRPNQSDLNICQSLFQAVEQGCLPSNKFSVFLSWSKSPEIIILCIEKGPSINIRRKGICHFGKALADQLRWEAAWTAAGGTEGLLNIFSKISVNEVKGLAKAIGRCNHGKKIQTRERAVEELLCALLPSHYQISKYRSQDKRPVQDHYALMLPACSPDFVRQLLDAKDESNPLYRLRPNERLIKTHWELLQPCTVGAMFGEDTSHHYADQCFKAFVSSQPPLPGPDPKISASMAFALKTLRMCSNYADLHGHLPKGVSEAELVDPLLRRWLKKRLPEDDLHEIFMLGLHLLAKNPQLAPSFRGIWSKLIARWKRFPTLYEDSLSLALSLGLGGSQKTLSQDFLQISRSLEHTPDLRWPLLKLYCLHIPKDGIDLDTTNNFQALSNQQWHSFLFYQLRKDHAILLLKGLYNANLEYTFLQVPGKTSILSLQDISTQRNFNVVLLLTILQRESETPERAARAVDELRKKAAIAREQPERAQLAKAASAYAIASGNLDLYGETVIWQQRYVRDPLTVKEVFGLNAVKSNEGIELLSGIPQPLPEDIGLAEVGSRVEKANEILLIFDETMRIAKREPSFYQPDWNHVASLFGEVIAKRVVHAKELQKRFRGPETDMYTAIWDGTLSMLQKVNGYILDAASCSITTLFNTLPPTSLAATTKAILEAGNERRKKQDREPGDDTLERLSYEVLLRLTKSEKPELARQLVLQTILDRPDASSWHRRLLSVPLLNSLSAKEAHDMLLVFAASIGEKLEEQSFVRVGEAQQPPSAPPQSLVKVTTVKHLAQLLHNAEFISADAAVEVLVELFKAGTHRDIRLATLESLLSVLIGLCNENWKSNALVEKILVALETAIPIVGSIDERRPPRPEDWEEARKTGSLLDISDVSAGLPPLLAAVLAGPAGGKIASLQHLRAEFVNRFFLPILEYSKIEHRKWIAMFLDKYKSSFTIDDLPATPLTPLFWDTLLKDWSDFLPRSVLTEMNNYTILTIAPPTNLKDFNDSLKNNIELRNKPDVQHWLLIFDQRMTRYPRSTTHKLLNMIHHTQPHPLVNNGISYDKISTTILQHASVFLDDYENYTEIWDNFTQDLRHSKNRYTAGIKFREDADAMRKLVTTWQRTGKLLLENIIILISEKRNKALRENKHIILPSTTKLRLCLLPYPCYPDPTELETQCKHLASELEKLLIDFLRPDILRWSKIAQDAAIVSHLLNTAEERLYVALYFGELRGSGYETTTALNLVRVTVVLKLIEDGKDGFEKDGKGDLSDGAKVLVRRLRKMIGEWRRDFGEVVEEEVVEWRRERRDIWRVLMDDS